MEEVIDRIKDVQGVKAVKREGDNVLKLKLFSSEIKGSEAVKIRGNLRSISQQLVKALDSSQEEGEISRWTWMEKPEKKYQETSLGKRKSLKDRKEKGHRPGYYKIHVEH